MSKISQVPTIILSAIGDDEYVPQGLRAGAKDYVVKLFSAGTSRARVETVRRRDPGGRDAHNVKFLIRSDLEGSQFLFAQVWTGQCEFLIIDSITEMQQMQQICLLTLLFESSTLEI